MQNPLVVKITDIKFALKRLETECIAQEKECTRSLLEKAQGILDEAIDSADLLYSPPRNRDEN